MRDWVAGCGSFCAFTFIVTPVIGHLDDLILVPLGVLLAVRLITDQLMDKFRQCATAAENRPVSRMLAAVFVLNLACLRGWVVGGIYAVVVQTESALMGDFHMVASF
ncbi:hypothetical protein HA051_01655 [Chromobacterium vaccinii]|nr:hypothetical protein [Chromobacterium vaccinii]